MEIEANHKIDTYLKLFFELKKGEYFGRLGRTFRTDDNFYFLDTGTGKIATVKENVYLVLKSLLESDNFETLFELDMKEDELVGALKDIKLAVEKENILSAPILEKMVGEATNNLEELLLTKTTSLTLELTEECNLRCKYCIYHPAHPSYREFGKKHMSWDIAKKAIDFLHQYSSANEDTTHIGFYGGEPLLNFVVLKSTIEYANEVFKNKKIHYNLTTNAILLTSAICDYLVENEVSITISLDGPKEVHDKNRIFSNDKGSFDSVKKGIKNLVQSYEKFNKEPNFLLNMVASDSNATEKYDLIYEFFANCDWLPKDILITCSGIDRGPHKMNYVLPQSEAEKREIAHMKDLLGVWSDAKTKDYAEYEKNFSTDTVNQPLVRIHKRFIANEPTKSYPINGCCTPGQRKAYVTVNGDILPCERVGTHIPTLGNINKGYDIEKIKRYYVDEYINKSKEYCKNCWAVNLCGICYNNCYDENGIDINYKHNLCLEERFAIEDNLVRYHKIFEKNPRVLEVFNEMELS